MKKVCLRKVIVFAAISLLFVIAALLPARRTYAASTAAKAKSAYAKMIKKKIKIKCEGAYPGAGTETYTIKTGKYDIIYLDKDSVPELVVTSNEGVSPWAVFTYKKGKIVQVASGALITDFTGYYKKTGVMRLKQHQEFVVYFYRKMTGTTVKSAAKKDAGGRKLTKPSWKKLKIK